MKTSNLCWLVAGMLLVAGCGGGPNAAYTDAVPDYDGLSLEISGATSENASAEIAPVLAMNALADGGAQTPINYLKEARGVVHRLNVAVRKVTGPIDDLIAANAKDLSAGSKQFGPVTRGNVSYRLTIAKRSDGRFGWRLQGEPAASTGTASEAYVNIAAGLVKKGTLPHRGRGVMGVDLDALASIDPSFPGAGKMLVGFAHVGDAKALTYALKNFTDDQIAHQPLTAAFIGHRLDPSKKTRVRFAAYDNIPGSADPTTQELVRARVHYVPGVAGRADLRATLGDVPAGKVWLASACWNAQEAQQYQVVYQCDQGVTSRSDPSCTVIEQVGTQGSCDPSVSTPEPPPVDSTDASPEQDAPTDPEPPPATMPSGT